MHTCNAIVQHGESIHACGIYDPASLGHDGIHLGDYRHDDNSCDIVEAATQEDSWGIGVAFNTVRLECHFGAAAMGE
jgi:hypothetical protein